MRVVAIRGFDARSHLHSLAEMRLKVFREFPYCYEGSLEEEAHYLEMYLTSRKSIILLAYADGDQVVGASTALPLAEAHAEFRQPFEAAGFRPEITFYMGESVVLPAYRRKGLGTRFFQERESHARKLGGFEHYVFLTVVRPPDDPRRPDDYQPPSALWRQMRYRNRSDIIARYEWTEHGQSKPVEHRMEGWVKSVHQ